MTDFRALCAELADSLEDWLSSNSIGGISLDDGTDAELIFRARTALAQPEPQGPVPVTERLPGPEDCDAEGRCWLTSVDVEPGWVADNPEQCTNWTHWLPRHALPVPRQEADHG
jgi:hypothetical protein